MGGRHIDLGLARQEVADKFVLGKAWFLLRNLERSR